MGQRVGIVVNPAAGAGRAARPCAELPRLVAAAGHEVVALTGRSAHESLEQARAAAADGSIDALVVVGGDGSVNLAVNACARTRTPLLVVPAGTGNDIADELGLGALTPARAVELLDSGARRAIDLGRFTGADGASRWFAGVLAAGFDSIVNERANRWRRPRGRARYVAAVLRELPVFRPLDYELTLDGERRRLRTMLVAVGNTASYGGGMRACPDAVPDDGQLDVLVVHELSIPAFLRVFPSVFSGGHVGHPRVELVRARRVGLDAPGVVAYADGERFGPLPGTVEVEPGALRVVVPAGPGTS